MSINPRTTIRMPPDGAGKAVAVGFFVHVEYTALSGNGILIGDEVTGLTSAVKGTVVATDPTNITTGYLDVRLSKGYEESSFTVGETLSIGLLGVTAQIQSIDIVNVNITQLVGQNNPTNGQYVDERGAAFVRYAEGAVHFDAFGFMQTTNLKSIGLYAPRYDELPYSMGTVQSGAGSFAYNAPTGSVFLNCTTASGDYISRRSNKYHQYQPGVGHLILLTVSVGDTGKSNVTRRWGYFDENNGVFFELDGTTLSVVLRKNMGAGIEEERISSNNWNNDRLDGSGLSQMTIDVSKNNIWWMDLAYLGAGRVRMGVFSSAGERVTAHVFENSNENAFSYMRTATLPINVEQFNTGLAASPSQLNFQIGAVYAENNVPRVFNHFGARLAPKTVTDSTPKHLASFRVTDLYKGLDNRLVVLPSDMDMVGVNAAGEIRPVRTCIAFIPTLTNPSWVPHPDPSSGVEFCTDAIDDLTAGSRIIYTGVVMPGKALDFTELFFYEGSATLNKYANGSRPWVSVFVSPVIPTDELTVYGDITWREYE